MSFTPYTLNVPQAPSLPLDDQQEILDNFTSLNDQFGVDHIPFGHLIEDATSANPCVVTITGHRFQQGWTVLINNLKGTDDAGQEVDWTVNGQSSTINVLDDNSFELDTIDSSSEEPYVENSGNAAVTATVDSRPFYGLHKQVTFQQPILTVDTSEPTFQNPQSVLFTEEFTDIPGQEEVLKLSLNFQNAGASSVRLADQNFTKEGQTINHPAGSSDEDRTGYTTITQRGFNTPFGFKINFGYGKQVLTAIGNQVTIPLKVSYNVRHWSTVTSLLSWQMSSSGRKDGRIKVPTTTLNSFDIRGSNLHSPTGLSFYFISIGE